MHPTKKRGSMRAFRPREGAGEDKGPGGLSEIGPLGSDQPHFDGVAGKVLGGMGVGPLHQGGADPVKFLGGKLQFVRRLLDRHAAREFFQDL